MSQQYYYSTLTGQQLDAALEQVSQVGASVEAAARSAEAAAESARLAQDAAAGNLPVGGENLGGVKNGGNVVINADGTMDAPAGGGSNQPLTFIGAVSATYDGSQAVEVEIPQGGCAELQLIDTVSLSEPVSSIYRELGNNYKRVRIEINGLQQDNDSTSKVVSWITLNSEGYNAAKAFSLHETKYPAGGVIYGSVYNGCFAVIDISFSSKVVLISYQGLFGTGAVFENKYSRLVSDVGADINSIYMYLPGVNMAAGLEIDIYGGN